MQCVICRAYRLFGRIFDPCLVVKSWRWCRYEIRSQLYIFSVNRMLKSYLVCMQTKPRPGFFSLWGCIEAITQNRTSNVLHMHPELMRSTSNRFQHHHTRISCYSDIIIFGDAERINGSMEEEARYLLRTTSYYLLPTTSYQFAQTWRAVRRRKAAHLAVVVSSE